MFWYDLTLLFIEPGQNYPRVWKRSKKVFSFSITRFLRSIRLSAPVANRDPRGKIWSISDPIYFVDSKILSCGQVINTFWLFYQHLAHRYIFPQVVSIISLFLIFKLCFALCTSRVYLFSFALQWLKIEEKISVRAIYLKTVPIFSTLQKTSNSIHIVGTHS